MKCKVNNIKFVVVYKVYIKFTFHIPSQNNTLGHITFNSQTLHKSMHVSPKFNTKKLLVKINIVITTVKT